MVKAARPLLRSSEMDISVGGGGSHAAAVYISDTGAGYCKFEELSGLLVQNASASVRITDKL